MFFNSFVVKIGLIIAISATALLGSVLLSYKSSRWVLLQKGPFADGVAISNIYFSDAKHGWMLGVFELEETTDGGESWTTKLSSNPPEKAFYSMTFTSSKNGFIVGSKQQKVGKSPLIIFTNDGGVNWQEANINEPAFNQEEKLALYDIRFCSSQVGWTVGSGLIFKTADGGQTWQRQYIGGKDETLSSIACANDKLAWVVETDGAILQTVDGGQSWSHQKVDDVNRLLRVRYLVNKLWVVGNEGTLLCSNDNGKSWDKIKLNTSETLFDIYADERGGWVVGTNGTILSSNNMQNWQKENSPTNNGLTSMFFLHSKQGWIGGENVTLLKLSN